MGKFLAILLLGCAVLAGGGMYYLQVHAFYERIEGNGRDDVVLTLAGGDAVTAIPYRGFEAIDSDSSPIRYRACFTTGLAPEEMAATYAPYPRAVPLNAPRWFSCFDAREIGAALSEGRAQAFMGQENFRYGIDRVVAIMPDGRGFVWHQINRCGAQVFDGRPVPEGCPAPPERE